MPPSRNPFSCASYLSTTRRPQAHRLVVDGTYERLADIPIAGNEARFKAYLEPCGIIRVGRCPPQGFGRKSFEERKRTRLTVLGHLYGDVLSSDGAWDSTTPTAYCPSEFPNLPCQMLQPVASRGRRIAEGLTQRGKRIIRNGTHLLERAFGVTGLGFYTLTCPFSAPYEIQEFNSKFPLIIKRFLEEVRRIYVRKGLKFSYVGVYEIQTKRYQQTGIPVLHYHYVSPCWESRGRFVVSSHQIGSLFARIIKNITGLQSCHNPRVGTEVIRKSAGKYLAKYFSKGSSDCDKENFAIFGINLSTWYSVDRSLLILCKQTTREYNLQSSEAIFRDCQRRLSRGDDSLVYPIEVETSAEDCRRLLVGFVVYPTKQVVEMCNAANAKTIYLWRKENR